MASFMLKFVELAKKTCIEKVHSMGVYISIIAGRESLFNGVLYFTGDNK